MRLYIDNLPQISVRDYFMRFFDHGIAQGSEPHVCMSGNLDVVIAMESQWHKYICQATAVGRGAAAR